MRVGLEQLDRLLHMLSIRCDDPETSAVLNIQPGEVEGQKKELPAIDNHELAVVADQVVVRSGNSDTCGEQTYFQFTQMDLASAIRIGDQRMNMHAAADRAGERFLDLPAVETEDEISTLFFAPLIAFSRG